MMTSLSLSAATKEERSCPSFPEAKQYNIIARSSVALAAAVLCGFPYKCIIQICKSSSVIMIGVEQGISFH